MRVTRSGLFGYHQARFTADRCDGLTEELRQMVGEERHTTEPSALEIMTYAIVAILIVLFAVFALISQEMPADWQPTEAH